MNRLKLNLEFLKDIYLTQSPSGNEQAMITLIIKYIYSLNQNITFELDIENNLFITKNTTDPVSYPCLVAHMDEVLTYKHPREIVINKNIIRGRYITTKQQCGLGCDDKNGIYVALHLLKILPNLKICFTTQEEIGGIGASEASLNIDFFENCRFMLQADRMGKDDLITQTNGIIIASNEFLSDIASVVKKYDYSEHVGLFTDVGILKENINICALNISCGYYNAHTHYEHTIITELQNCLNLIYDIILLNNKTYEHTVDFGKQNYYYRDYTNYYDKCNNCMGIDCTNCETYAETWK